MTDTARTLRHRRRTPRGGGVAFSATLVIHTLAVGLLFGEPAELDVSQIPVYTVRLVAAPRPEPETRQAPEVVERQAPQPQMVADRPPVRRVEEAPPPPDPDVEREPAPRTTPEEEPLPEEEPSSGDDPTTIDVAGVNFPYPEYLNNIVTQVYRRWRRPAGKQSLRAEVLFFVRRDGTITNLQFIQRSGSFAFDIEAQGAVEAAGNTGAFGPLPEGFSADILPVSFFFDPRTLGPR